MKEGVKYCPDARGGCVKERCAQWVTVQRRCAKVVMAEALFVLSQEMIYQTERVG